MLVILRVVERLQGIGIALNAADIFGRAGVFSGNQVCRNSIFFGVLFFTGGDVGEGNAMFSGVAQVVDEDETVPFFFQQVAQGVLE